MEHAHEIHEFMRSAFHKMSAQDTIYSNGTGQFQTSKNLKSSKFDHILVPTTNFEGYSISTSVEKKKKLFNAWTTPCTCTHMTNHQFGTKFACKPKIKIKKNKESNPTQTSE